MTNHLRSATTALERALEHLDAHRTEALRELTEIELDVVAARLRLTLYARRLAGEPNDALDSTALLGTLELHRTRLAQAEIELGRARLSAAAQCADAPERLAGASARAGDAAELVRSARRQILDAD